MSPESIYQAEVTILAYIKAEYEKYANLVQAERNKHHKSFSYSDNLKRMGDLQVVLNELNSGLVQKAFS